ncbi:MAG TPA: TOMM precursor leader peptide-binding protein [Gaiellaceae bacterium]|jgi:bacteriocin biosynthesis cyclodehydratase domain-containing protein
MDVPDRPLLSPWYRIVGDGERLILEHAQVAVVLEGAAVRTLLPHLLPLLDGTRTVAELVARLGIAARPAVDLALALLAEHGVLAEGPPAPERARASAHAFAAAFDVSPRVAAERLRAGSVGVVGGGPAAADVARLLHLAGVEHVPHLSWRRGADVDVAVVAPALDEVDGLQPWNSLALERGMTWLPVRPWDGRCAFVGPLVVPGESCCYECTLLRRAANVDWGGDLVDVDSAPVAATADAAVEASVAGIAAHLALRWLVARDTTIPGVVHAVEVRPALALTTHHVLRVPRCPACSPAERVAAPLPWHEAEAA